jgi:hypothetical protein
MPCGARARLTAYVSYRMVAFAEREVLLTALADLGFTQVEIASFPTETTNPIPVVDASGSVVGTGALVDDDGRRMRLEQLLCSSGEHLDHLTDRVELLNQRLELDAHCILDGERLAQFRAA